ncbi:SFCGS family glycine-rich protein [Streptomyces sp. CA-132043]|uniref:SFCGS family glycine-rich protein n=1 Tax=Streptomyces sp. CA-132043 TaxID=3240048 RepID=UPI003D8F3AE7
MTPTSREAPDIERLAAAVAGTARPLTGQDRAELAELLPLVGRHARDAGLRLEGDRRLAVTVHALAFLRRVRDGERLDPLGPEVHAEIPAAGLNAARVLVAAYCEPRGRAADDTEAALFALHFEAARRAPEHSDTEETAMAVKIVIGHRLGKGQAVAEGVRKAGAEPVLIPGPGADMKVGDVMAAEGAVLGISFCGSGGAGAVTAKAKYGHDIEFGMRSAQARGDRRPTGPHRARLRLPGHRGPGLRGRRSAAEEAGGGGMTDSRLTVRVAGSGPTRERAFAAAMGEVRKRVGEAAPGVCYRVEPLTLDVVSAVEHRWTERFLGVLFARQRRRYDLELRVTVRAGALDLAALDFAVREERLSPLQHALRMR